MEACSVYNVIFRDNFNSQHVCKTLLSNVFFSKWLFLQSPFRTFVSQYLIMLRHCGSAYSKGNFTTFKMVCITQILFFPTKWYLFLGRLYTFRISHFVGTSWMFSQNTPQNTKHSLYTFRISCEFRVLSMLWINKPWNHLTFCTNADPGSKCKKPKKGAQNAKKVTQNSPLYTFCFSYFAIIFAYFVISV